MAIYIFATALSIAFASLSALGKRSALVRGQGEMNKSGQGVALAVISALILTLVSALRYEVGTDWYIYYEHFYEVSETGAGFYEEGFNILNKIVYFIYPNFSLMIAVCSVINCGFVFKAIYDNSINYAFSILFFVIGSLYFNSMNQIRQSMVIAVFLYTIKFIKQRKLLKYLIIIIALSTIHISAVILIPVYFLYGLKVKISVHALVLGLSIALIIPLNYVIEFIISKTRYAWYLQSVYAQMTNFYLIGFLFYLALLMLYVFYYYYGEDDEDKEYNFAVNMQLVGTAILIFSSSIPQINRLSICFYTPSVLFIPKMFKKERIQSRRIILVLIVISIHLVKLFYDIYINKWYDVIPYQSILGLGVLS